MSRVLFWGLLGVVLASGFWSFYLEPRSLRVRVYEIELPDWPSDRDPMRMALLSDLHVGSPYYDLEKLREIVARTNATEPEIVLLAGDYVSGFVLGGKFVAPEAMTESLSKLAAPLGVYAVLGNHDLWFDSERVRRALTDAGVRVLEDEAVRLPAESTELWLAGLRDYRAARPDVGRALRPIPDGALVLALTHNPDLFPEIPQRVSLTLAGHTHGGQAKFPFLGTPIVPSKHGSRFAQGHIVEEERHLFVTSGLGTTIIAVRFRVAPEISLIEVRGPRTVRGSN